eukprot:COSAG01_NODE_836_length_13206_cov_139.627375_11_plen_41_part_00
MCLLFLSRNIEEHNGRGQLIGSSWDEHGVARDETSKKKED